MRWLPKSWELFGAQAHHSKSLLRKQVENIILIRNEIVVVVDTPVDCKSLRTKHADLDRDTITWQN